MEFLNYLASFAFVIIIVVSIHEFGHYYAAKKLGVFVEIFSIGVGPEIFSFKNKEGTKFRLALIPIGGYVKMFGDASVASNSSLNVNLMDEEKRKKSFHFKPKWAKSIIIAAGPAANFILAIALLFIFYFHYGKIEQSAILAEITENGAAQEAGLLKNDQIIEVDGFKVNGFNDLRNIVSMSAGIQLKTKFIRNHQEMQTILTPRAIKSKDALGNQVEIGRIGASSTAMQLKNLSAGNALIESVVFIKNTCHLTLKSLGNLISGKSNADNMGGPIKIIQYSGQSAKQGIASLFWFIAILSINLGLINLLPIPMLDGGHLFFYALETITRKEISPKIQELTFKIGALFLFSTMIYFTINDIQSFIN